MKSITIHGLDSQLDKLIREKAKKEGTSLNKVMKKLLAEALGVSQQGSGDHRDDFLDLFGVWSDEEMDIFDRSVADLRKIDNGDWQ
jgi:hypothetical protein